MLSDCRALGLSRNTVKYYRAELELFLRWAHVQGLVYLDKITTYNIRQSLTDKVRTQNAGGMHGCYRFLRVRAGIGQLCADQRQKAVNLIRGLRR